MSVRRAPSALVTIAVLTALALVATGCGGDDDPNPPGDEPVAEAPVDGAGGGSSPFDRDACELLTDADLEVILGEPVEGEFTAGDESTLTPGQCEWTDGNADVVDPAASGIVLFLGDEQIFENTRILAEGGGSYEELDGIGDEAYAGDGEGGVRIGEAGVTVTPLGVNTNAPETHDLVVDLLGRVAVNY